MKMLSIKPTIYKFKTAEEFAAEFKIGVGDLVITNEYIYQPFFGKLNLGCDVLYQEKYGAGEPSDDMAEAMYKDIKGDHKRVIAIGGGTVIDISKLFALKTVSPILDLYDGKTEIVKDKELVLVPTTCGTGSEVTNISIINRTRLGVKMGLTSENMFADYAVLVPELLAKLPLKVFGASSIDALVHAVESSLSPKATVYTKLMGYKAIEMIITGYQKLVSEGMDKLPQYMGDFLTASNMAGFAFGTAGCAAVHALSYPLGGTYHVPHGESNYALFTGVLYKYMEKKQDGEIAHLNAYLAELLHCDVKNVYAELENLLNHILPKKPLHEYGVTEADIPVFTDNVLATQGRLTANNFVPLSRDDILDIYKNLY